MAMLGSGLDALVMGWVRSGRYYGSGMGALIGMGSECHCACRQNSQTLRRQNLRMKSRLEGITTTMIIPIKSSNNLCTNKNNNNNGNKCLVDFHPGDFHDALLRR